MGRKPDMPRITEPSTGDVHYEGAPFIGSITLCGLNDFIGVQAGEHTQEPVTCVACKAVFDWCNTHHA
ncbi:hypothetical protein [Burkholderia sp. Tr-20390]|uniref:hypothetical protein n=1 Tax=Burkholderia sp. Tr-20390 TaxID=2703904 RepID=UPI0019813065|nr:hypothetical protein [Burkholderia sp. Tr-20390]MBN3729453.1 hypothetical protein [Burkholderia sp. Tr-20390]